MVRLKMIRHRKLSGVAFMKPSDLEQDEKDSCEDIEEVQKDFSIRCINCGYYYFIHEIQPHSAACLQLQESERELEGKRPNITTKLVKLSFSLEKTLGIIQKAGDRNYLRILLRICKELASVNKVEDIAVNHRSLESLSSLLVTFRGNETMKLYGERLKALAREQQKAIGSLDSQIEFYKAKVQSLESALTSKTGLKNDCLKAIDDPNSEVGSRESSFDLGSAAGLSELTSSFNSSFERYRPANSQVDPKRIFYSKCLTLKLSLPHRCKANVIPISQLYRRAVQQKVTEADFDEYIRANLLGEKVELRQANSIKMSTLFEDLYGEEADG